MHCWYLTLTGLFVVITGDVVEYKFSQGEAALLRCIEDHDIFKNVHHYGRTETVKAVADLVAKRFSGKTLTSEELIPQVMTMVREIKSQSNSVSDAIDNLFWLNMESMLLTALSDCNTESYVRLNSRPVPRFSDEHPVLAALLDFILVDWPISLGRMLSTRNGRAILRSYANQAEIILRWALMTERNFGFFRASLRMMWTLRAHRYFDGRNSHFPYISHSYNVNDLIIITFSNLNTFSLRIREIFELRNPRVSEAEIGRILNIHTADSSNSGEYDIYNEYQASGMGSSMYYLESHINQFYRILFFFMELRTIGIIGNEEDVYDGPLPEDRVPSRLQRIVTNDDAYRDYLLTRRRLEVRRGDHQNSIVQSLARNSRVMEEDLVMVPDPHMISSFIVRNFHARSTTEATNTTLKITETTPGYGDRKRGKDRVEDNNNSCKQRKTTFSNCCRGTNDKSTDTSDWSKFKAMCLKQKLNCDVTKYKEIVFDSMARIPPRKALDNWPTFFDSEESFFFRKTLNRVMKPLIRWKNFGFIR